MTQTVLNHATSSCAFWHSGFRASLRDDDFIGQGGTIANLRGHIEQQGGHVIAATVLTGKPFSATLRLSPAQLAILREKHGNIENWWLTTFGFGFDCLTESEARYLIRTPNAEHIRNRITASA